MKQKILISCFILSILITSIAFGETRLKTEEEKLSYSLGLSIGQSFSDQGIVVDSASLLKGIEDALNQREPLMTTEEIKATMELFRTNMAQKMRQKNDALAETNIKEGALFLKDNAKKDGIHTTASGLQYKIIKEGTGKTPTMNDTVETNYEGTLINGTVFDSSYKRGKSVTFPVSGVIKGWTEALLMMKTGAKWKLFIPSNLAYGERGAGNIIGPNETLIFDIELLDVK